LFSGRIKRWWRTKCTTPLQSANLKAPCDLQTLLGWLSHVQGHCLDKLVLTMQKPVSVPALSRIERWRLTKCSQPPAYEGSGQAAQTHATANQAEFAKRMACCAAYHCPMTGPAKVDYADFHTQCLTHGRVSTLTDSRGPAKGAPARSSEETGPSSVPPGTEGGPPPPTVPASPAAE
jgi:hypothetical protein